MLCGSLGLTVFGPATSAKADPDCMDGGVYVVFARGSGEAFDGSHATAFRNTVKSAVYSAVGVPRIMPMGWVELGNLDAAYQAQDQLAPGKYPAVGYADWGAPLMDGYYNSVWTGVSELVTHLNDRAHRCPKESIVVGGYSQGAEVVGDAMNSISDYTRSHIGYVAMYGDPRSTACNMVVRVPWARGSANCAVGSLDTRIPYVPSSLVDRTGSWCDSRDGICTSNLAYMPFPGNSLSTHGSAYQNLWIANSAKEIANKALGKYNQLNPSSTVSTGSYTITPPDTSPDSPAAAPPTPVVKSVKRTTAPNGTREVYAATKSSVTEAWWNPGEGVQSSEIIHIAQDNIVGFDKVNEPDGVTQSLYAAVPDGIWESWWRPGEGIHHNKIVTGLSGVRQVIADPQQESAGYTHRLYVLAQDGPYEVWWRDGGDGVHVSHLDSINGAVAMTKSKGPDGTEQLYVATPTWVYELWWHPGENSVHTGALINITQGNIKSLSKAANSADGKQRLYTGTTTGVWESSWGGGVNLSHNYIVSGQTNAIQVEKNAYGGVDQLYLATGNHVQEYWWTPSNGGGSTLINISQNNITAMDKVNDGENQAVYTASGDLIYETWWRAGNGPNTNVLFKVQR